MGYPIRLNVVDEVITLGGGNYSDLSDERKLS
jgi:hypothetical protein